MKKALCVSPTQSAQVRTLLATLAFLAIAAAARAQDPPDADRWTTHGPDGGAIRSLALDPTASATLYAGSDAGIFKSTDRGASWLASGLVSSPTVLVPNPSNPAIVFAGNASGLFRSSDAGAHFTVLAGITFPVQAVAIDPADSSRVYAGGTIHTGQEYAPSLSKSSDGGATWTPASTLIIDSIASLLIDPRRTSTIIAGADYCCGMDYPLYPAIARSDDSGATWSEALDRYVDDDFILSVPALTIDPAAGALLAGTVAWSGSWVFRSTDFGATWQRVGRPIPASLSSLAVDPATSTLYAGTNGGVFRSIDSGGSWWPMHTGLIDLNVTSLALDPVTSVLHAGTGTGVYEVQPGSSSSAFPCTPGPETICMLDGRFQVELLAQNPRSGLFSPGTAVSRGEGFGYFSLPAFTGDASLPEVLVKMVDASVPPWNSFWFFYSGLTDVTYSLFVLDTVTGSGRIYRNDPNNPFCGGADTAAFPAGTSGSSAMTATRAASDATLVAAGPTLFLLSDRFRLTLSATDPRTGTTTAGVAIPQGDRYGYFSLPGFTGDEHLPEVVVKMLDATSLHGAFWLFHTGLTDVAYTLTVTDRDTGRIQVYESVAPFCGAADTTTFHPPAPPPPGTPDVIGLWTGFFETNDAAHCATHVAVSIGLSQDGSLVTSSGFGAISACGMAGHLQGTLEGTAFTGSVARRGYTGGATVGTMSESVILLQIGDLLRPNPDCCGPEVVPGGTLELGR